MAVCSALGSTGRIYIYGELFGGEYPHAQVEALPGIRPVQTGIWYAPTLHFAAFDLLVVPANADDNVVFLAHSSSTPSPARLGCSRSRS